MTTDIDAILKRLARKGAKAAELLLVYEYETDDYKPAWKADSRLYRAFARKLIKEGHPTRAFELARQGLADHPNDPDLLYCLALAMARVRNIVGAERHLEDLFKLPAMSPELRVEAVSLQGRLWKDRFDRERNEGLRKEYATNSLEQYLEAMLLPKADSFPMINAATMSLLVGDNDQSRSLAEQVIKVLSNEPESEPDNYWPFATLGEAHLLLGDLTKATELYMKAVAKAREQNAEGDIASMRRNALLIKERLKISEDLIALFYLGSVVVFAGHMIDHPGRGARERMTPRFPGDPELIQMVREAIREKLQNLNATIGICSAACGADILFAEEVLERKGELHIVLPHDLHDFYLTSVDFGQKHGAWPAWRARCDAVLARATEVHYATTEKHLGDDEVLFNFSTKFTQGLAILRSEQRGVNPEALLVCDECDPKAPVPAGGTSYFLSHWKRLGLDNHPTIIDLADLREKAGLNSAGPVSEPAASPEAAPAAQDERMERNLKSMLFADVKDFSTVTDPFLPKFFKGFLGAVSNVLQELETKPVARNTWGDGLYLVFDKSDDRAEVVACADAALQLLERAEGLDWKGMGLKEGSPLRIGVHTGPVFQGPDPVIERENYYGSQVTRTARIEPVTMPGCAFASEQFAALLAVEARQDYVCEYIGVEKLPKGYGRCALYRLGRR